MRFEGTFEKFENTQRRKVIQMQSVWLCVISSEPFEEAFDNTYRGHTTVSELIGFYF